MCKINSSKRNDKKKSRIFDALDSFSLYMRTAFSQSLFCRILTGGDVSSSEPKGIIVGAIKKIPFKKRVSVPFKRYMANRFENSAILSNADRLIHRIRDIEMKAIGAFFFAFGVYAVMSSLIGHFALQNGDLRSDDLFIGIVIAVCGALISASSKTLSDAVCDSRILNFLLCRVLGIRIEKLKSNGSSCGKNDVALLIGVATGILSDITSVTFIVTVIPIAILMYAILALPECGIVLTILSLPFFSSSSLIALSIYVSVCWLLKLIRGKRTFTLRFTDVCFILLGAVLLLGGMISVTPDVSKKTALVYIALMFSYISAVNLIKTSEWTGRCLKCAIFSFSVITVLHTIEQLLLKFGVSDISNIISGNILSYLPHSSISAIITIFVPLLLAYALSSSNGDNRFGLYLLVVAAIICGITIGTKTGIVSVIISTVLFFVITNKRSLPVIILLILFLPAIFAVMPSQITDYVIHFFNIKDVSFSSRVLSHDSAEYILGISQFGGIGIGRQAVAYALPDYASGSYRIMSIYDQMSASTGIAGMIIFAVWICSFIRYCSRYLKSVKSDFSRSSLSVAACFSGICGCLAEGFAENIFSSPQSFLVFWLTAALAVSMTTTLNAQHTENKLQGPSIDIDVIYLKGMKSVNGKD